MKTKDIHAYYLACNAGRDFFKQKQSPLPTQDANKVSVSCTASTMNGEDASSAGGTKNRYVYRKISLEARIQKTRRVRERKNSGVTLLTDWFSG